MGLDIYFYHCRDKKLGEDYMKAGKEYDDAYARFEKKYEKELGEAYKKWEKWYNAESERIDALPDDAPDSERELNRASEPGYEISDFLNPEEKAEWDAIKDTYNSFAKDLDTGYQKDIGDLYMRKKNWMVRYVEERHPERLIEHPDYGKILESACAVLDRDDIEELVSRMDRILNGMDTIKGYEETTGKKESEDGFFRTQEAIDWYNSWTPPDGMAERAHELLPTMGRFFFGSTDYDYDYFSALLRYRKKFQEWLDTSPADEVLFYLESW
jgi:hypothetical protein